MNVPWEWKTFWAHLMVLLANGGQEEARFDPFGDSVNLVARLVKRKLVSVCLEVVLISGQHRYTVCAECTMGLEIILGTADGTPRCRESCGSSCQSIWR